MQQKPPSRPIRAKVFRTLRWFFIDKSKSARKGKAPERPVSSGSDICDSDLLPILHYSELHLVSDYLTKYPGFYLIGHPLPPPPFEQAKYLHTLPEEDKAKLVHPRRSTVRGYNHAKSSGREWWDYSPEDGGRHLSPNDAEFQKTTKEYFDAGIKLLQQICKQFNIANKTELVPNEVIDSPGFSTMRYLRYSPQVFPAKTKQQTEGVPTDDAGYDQPRMEAHTDHGVLTLMTSTEPSGLYIWDKKGKIYDCPPVDGTVLVIAGDLMTHFTTINKKSPLDEGAVGPKTVLPTPHAVLIPEGAGERYSVAVFLRPNKERVVSMRKVKMMEGGEEKEIEESMSFSRWAEEKGKIRGRRCWMIGRGNLKMDDLENI